MYGWRGALGHTRRHSACQLFFVKPGARVRVVCEYGLRARAGDHITAASRRGQGLRRRRVGPLRRATRCAGCCTLALPRMPFSSFSCAEIIITWPLDARPAAVQSPGRGSTGARRQMSGMHTCGEQGGVGRASMSMSETSMVLQLEVNDKPHCALGQLRSF